MAAMPPTPAARHLRHALAQAVREGRTARGWTQAELARRADVSAGMVALVEHGEVNASIDLAGRLVSAAGVTLDLRHHVPFGGMRQRDAVHAWCMAYVQRRLMRDGWIVLREVEIGQGLMLGWIDLVAWHAGLRVVLVIEVKTQIRDLGQIERTLGWYARAAPTVARAKGWNPAVISRWLLVLATSENDQGISDIVPAVRQAFPYRSTASLATPEPVSALAMIDPATRRKRWLLPTWADGRRTRPRTVTTATPRSASPGCRPREGDEQGLGSDPQWRCAIADERAPADGEMSRIGTRATLVRDRPRNRVEDPPAPQRGYFFFGGIVRPWAIARSTQPATASSSASTSGGSVT